MQTAAEICFPTFSTTHTTSIFRVLVPKIVGYYRCLVNGGVSTVLYLSRLLRLELPLLLQPQSVTLFESYIIYVRQEGDIFINVSRFLCQLS